MREIIEDMYLKLNKIIEKFKQAFEESKDFSKEKVTMEFDTFELIVILSQLNFLKYQIEKDLKLFDEESDGNE